MAFWSGDTLKKQLSKIISYEDDSTGKEDQIDCAAYTLKVGPEVYLTPQESPGPKGNTKIKLENDEQFIIPPGQFVFVLTEEFVHVPPNVLAFISCKATYKFQGLVNVSGFHVDPGYNGRLVFSLYNAGPKEIALSRGADLFLIWFADLDTDASKTFVRDKEPYNNITDKLVNGISGEIFSPVNVNRKLDNLKDEFHRTIISQNKEFNKALIDQNKELQKDLGDHKVKLTLSFLGILITMLLYILRKPIMDFLFGSL